MYSDKTSVNILTALLVAHGIRNAVVCPGSRNAPIVHNFSECPDIRCYPVTDERSAAFFALGIAQASDEPVVVCVTSGTALLNVTSAIAEAHYQHQSLIVVSADRPAEWIGQLDGQTLQQPGALASWVSRTVCLPADGNEWYCNRLVNEALLDATSDCRHCVHINVPLTEPLFSFNTEALPEVQTIQRYTPPVDYDCLPQQLLDDLATALRPLIVFGQLSPRRFHFEGMDKLFSHVIVLQESLSPMTSISHFEGVLEAEPPECPDFILYIGDAIVSKRLKHYLRKAIDARCWRVSLSGAVEDTFQNLRGIVVGDTEFVLQSLSEKMSKLRLTYEAVLYRRQWLHLLADESHRIAACAPPYSEAAAILEFERRVVKFGCEYEVHYANSTPIRLANIYAKGHSVWCNRGVNGIDGTLSTAAGFAAATGHVTFCVIGDLSFFYDQNALWNNNINGNLRILLVNNGRGAIFDQLPGLEQSPVRHSLIAAAHNTTAEGICRQNGVDYIAANNYEELLQGLEKLLVPYTSHAVLLEVKVSP